MAQWLRTASANDSTERARHNHVRSLFGLDLVCSLDPAGDHGDGGEFRETRCATEPSEEVIAHRQAENRVNLTSTPSPQSRRIATFRSVGYEIEGDEVSGAEDSQVRGDNRSTCARMNS